MTATETTGWRDAALSARHRHWGFNVPAADVDLFMIEYDSGRARALVDYKIVGTREEGVNRNSPTMRALGGLYDETGRHLPFFVVYYDPRYWSFYVRPMNAAADAWVYAPMRLTEREWVDLLHLLRDREAPKVFTAPLQQNLGPLGPMSPEEAEQWDAYNRRMYDEEDY